MVQDELHVHDHIFLRIIIHVNFTIALFFQMETFPSLFIYQNEHVWKIVIWELMNLKNISTLILYKK